MLGVVGACHVLAELDLACIWSLETEGELHQGRLASAVGPHERDMIATIERHVSISVNEVIVKRLANMFDGYDHISRAGRLWETEVHVLGLLGEHDELALDLLDFLHALLGLSRLRGLVAEFVNEDLHMSDLALLSGALGSQLLEVVLALTKVAGVVARIRCEATVLERGHVGHAGIHERTVVAYEKNGTVIAGEELLEPLYALEIEVVRWLVQEQQVGMAEKELGEGDAHLPSAREILRGLVEILYGETETAKDGSSATLELIAAQSLKSVLSVAIFIQERLEPIASASVGNLRFELRDASAERANLLRRRHDLLEGGVMAGEFSLLLEIADGSPLLKADSTFVRGLSSHDDLEKRRLAGAVRANEGPALTRIEL